MYVIFIFQLSIRINSKIVLNLSITEEELAKLCESEAMDKKQIEMIYKVFEKLVQNKNEAIVNTCLRLSKLPLKQPETFENFDFSRLQGKDLEKLKSLSNLSNLYSYISKQKKDRTLPK